MVDDDLDKIKVHCERRDLFDRDVQLFVVTVKNESEHVFKGTVKVEGMSVRDTRVDSDTVILSDGLPGGGQTWAQLWFHEPSRITGFHYTTTGHFERSPPAP